MKRAVNLNPVKKKVLMTQLRWSDFVTVYLNQWLHTGLEDHVGVEEEGAQQGLWIAGQLSNNAREQDVDVEWILKHVL